MSVYFDPQGVLINWQDGPGFTLEMAASGSLVLGAIGSGKTRTVLAWLRHALLQSTATLPGGAGGAAFHAKNGDAQEWHDACIAAGRREDVVRITADRMEG
jgi:hypothetical protein